MNGRARLAVGVIACFIAAISGVFVGRALLPSQIQPGNELHEVLHHKLALNANQQARVEALEQRFSVQRRAFELELRADNARLAEAIEFEFADEARRKRRSRQSMVTAPASPRRSIGATPLWASYKRRRSPTYSPCGSFSGPTRPASSTRRWSRRSPTIIIKPGR